MSHPSLSHLVVCKNFRVKEDSSGLRITDSRDFFPAVAMNECVHFLVGYPHSFVKFPKSTLAWLGCWSETLFFFEVKLEVLKTFCSYR